MLGRAQTSLYGLVGILSLFISNLQRFTGAGQTSALPSAANVMVPQYPYNLY
jgi:hypothetical protein